MFVEFSIDKNVTFRETIEFLRNIGLIGRPEENSLYSEDKTLYFCLEIERSDICKLLQDTTKNNLYCSILNNKGITLFTIDDTDINTFIPMNNILSITIKNKETN